jgi:hypothetical protein
MKTMKHGFSLIDIMVGLLILSSVAVVMFPLVLSGVTGFAGIDNFTFSTLFSGSNNLFAILLSVGILAGALAYFGIKIGKKKTR